MHALEPDGCVLFDHLQYLITKLFIGTAISICMVNLNTRRTGIQVCARCEDQFPTQDVELLFGSTRFQHSSASPDHHSLKHGSNKLRIGLERVAGGLQHSYDRLIESESQLLHDL